MLTHSILSQTGCSIRSSCHISSNQDEQFVECHLVIVIIRDIKLQLTVIDRNKWVLVLSTRLPSLVSSSNCKSSHARIAPRSMLGMSRRNMVLNFQLGRSKSNRNNMGSLTSIASSSMPEPHSHVQQAWLAALFLAITQESSCEPYPRSPVDLPPNKSAEGPRLLFCVH